MLPVWSEVSGTPDLKSGACADRPAAVKLTGFGVRSLKGDKIRH